MHDSIRRLAIAALCGVLALTRVGACGEEKSITSNPIVAVFLRPWTTNDFMEADLSSYIPRFALYDDGSLQLWRADDRGQWSGKLCHLSIGEFERLRSLFSVSDKDRRQQGTHDLIPCIIDGPAAALYLATGTEKVYYVLRGYGDNSGSSREGSCARAASRVPEIERLIQYTQEYAPGSCVSWEPERYVVTLFPWESKFDEMPTEVVTWPNEWVDAESVAVGKSEYTVEVTGEVGMAIMKLHESEGGFYAVRVRDRLWSVFVKPLIRGQRELAGVMSALVQ